MDRKEIAVFGASGFVGRQVVRGLLSEGYAVRAIARATLEPQPHLSCRPLDVTTADVAELAETIRGCAAVVNLVGIKREQGAQTFAALHVRFVEHLLEAIRQNKIERLVHLSVVAARPDPHSGYHDTKWRAEELIARSGVAYTILRPGVIYGEGDDLLGHLTKMIRASGFFPIVGDGRTEQQPIDVADVARAVEASLRGEHSVGKTYAVVGPEPLTLREIVETVAKAIDRNVRIVGTSPVLMRPAIAVMNRIMSNPLSTPAQLQMLIDGMTGDPEPMRRELGIDPKPFTVERIRTTARNCTGRLPFDLRLGTKGVARNGPGRLAVLTALGIIVMNAAFLIRSDDTWSRVVSGIAILGAMVAPNAWRNRRELFRADGFAVGSGLASGLFLYAVAWLMNFIPAVAAETVKVSAWRAGHSSTLLLVTLLVAVVSEEIFWRGEITRLLSTRLPKWIAVVIGTVLFSIAHVGSGTWLLPGAAAGIVLTWNLLFVVSGSLAAPLISHLVFDLLAMLILPLG